MIRRSEHEPPEFRTIIIAAILISMFIGSVATLQSGSVPWGSSPCHRVLAALLPLICRPAWMASQRPINRLTQAG